MPAQPNERGSATVATAAVVIATLACIAFLYWARSFLVPIAFGVVLSFAFNPVVRFISRKAHVSRWVCSGAIVVGFWAVSIWSAYVLQDDAAELAARLPVVMKQLAGQLQSLRQSGESSMRKLREAARTLEQAAIEPVERVPREPMQVEMRPWRWSDWLWTGSAGLLTLLGQFVTVTFLMLFLLGSGETLKRKFVRFAGDSLVKRKRALRLVSAIGEQIQAAVIVLLVTNLLFGVAVGVAMRVLGMQNAGAWGAAAAVVHFIPYVGSGLMALAVGIAVAMQSDHWTSAIGAWAYVLFAATVIGVVVTTWMQSRMSRMDPTVVFVALLFWGWLWSVPGLLLALPITAIFKAVCDHVDRLRPVAQLIGEPSPRAAERNRRPSAGMRGRVMRVRWVRW